MIELEKGAVFEDTITVMSLVVIGKKTLFRTKIKKTP